MSLTCAGACVVEYVYCAIYVHMVTVPYTHMYLSPLCREIPMTSDELQFLIEKILRCVFEIRVDAVSCPFSTSSSSPFSFAPVSPHSFPSPLLLPSSPPLLLLSSPYFPLSPHPRMMQSLNLSELPPLVYQLLVLSTKGHKTLVLEGIQTLFNQLDENILSGEQEGEE